MTKLKFKGADRLVGSRHQGSGGMSNASTSHIGLVWGDGFMVAVLAAVMVATLSRHSDFATTTVINFGLFTLLAASLQLMLGFTNQASLTQAGVYGVGAYVSIYVETKLHVPIGVALVAAVLAGALMGLLFSLPLRRLREHFLAMATLAAQVILSTAFTHLNGLTGGINGEVAPAAHLNSVPMLAILLAVSCLVLVGLSHLRVSRFGRQLLALKVDETMASSVGIDVGRLRIAVVVVAFAIAAGAGFMLTETSAFIAPENFTLTTSLAVLVAVVLGGRSLRWGTLVGAGVYSALVAETTSFPGLSTIIIGVALVVILGYAPGGLTGLQLAKWAKSIRVRLGPSAGVAPSNEPEVQLFEASDRRAPEPGVVAK